MLIAVYVDICIEEEKINAHNRLFGAMMGSNSPVQEEIEKLNKDMKKFIKLLTKRLINYKIPMQTMRRREKIKKLNNILLVSYEEELKLRRLEHKELSRLIKVNHIR